MSTAEDIAKAGVIVLPLVEKLVHLALEAAGGDISQVDAAVATARAALDAKTAGERQQRIDAETKP